MRKYESVKQIDLTERNKTLQQSQKRNSSRLQSLSRSAKRSISRDQYETNLECLTDRLNHKPHKVGEFPQTTPITPTNKTNNIKTYVRFKPITNNELIHDQEFAVIQQLNLPNSTTVAYDENMLFTYDRVFEPQTHQKFMYEESVKELVQSFLNGYNGTVFAYGQTGSGKTYTMFGEADRKGMVPQAIDDTFNEIQTLKSNGAASVELSCSMLEIYRQNMIDLLAEEQKDLKIKETSYGIQVSGLSQQNVQQKDDIMKLLSKGSEMRKIRGTDVNERSSRSHLILTLYLEVRQNQLQVRKSKLNMVDLAGSEKVSKSKVSGEGLEEAKKINLSLSCLGNTINALSKGQEHIPFRDSKLTRVLQESLSGNSLTRVIVTCSMHASCQEETLSSLKFAHRVKKIKTGAIQNIQFRSSEQSINRVMYQTLKSSFKNYEEKIQQIKQLLNSEGLINLPKDELVQMLSMIINGEQSSLAGNEGMDTDRRREDDQNMLKKKRKVQYSVTTQDNDEHIKELESRIKDLQQIILKQQNLIEKQTKQLSKWERNRIKIKQNPKKQSLSKDPQQLNPKIKVMKVKTKNSAENHRTQNSAGKEDKKISEIHQILVSFRQQKKSYQKMQKSILLSQIDDLMNRLCGKTCECDSKMYNQWKALQGIQKQQEKQLQGSMKRIAQLIHDLLGKNQRNQTICTDIGNLMSSPKQSSPGFMSRINSSHRL